MMMRIWTVGSLLLTVIIVGFLVNSSIRAQESDSLGVSPKWQCDSSVGLVKPPPVCSAVNPCRRLLPTYPIIHPGMTQIDRPSQGKPFCGTGKRGKRTKRPVYNDGEPREVTTSLDNMTRYYCQYTPPGTSTQSKRPLVIFVHGSGGNAGGVYDATSLRTKAPAFNLSGDSKRPGFVLISAQSRNLHWPTKDPQDGAKFDSYHRNLKTNVDVEYLDAIIDQAVSEGLVDPKQIYLMGWSNGARYTAFYGLNRHESSTPGGNRVAAVANFSGGDPFENIQDNYSPSCQLKNYPTSKLPFYMISRNCDGVTCNEDHATAFRNAGKIITPGNVAGTWIHTLKTKIGNSNVKWQRINYKGKPSMGCMPTFMCNSKIGFFNHLFWPDGIEDKGGRDWEPTMLNFLKRRLLKTKH